MIIESHFEIKLNSLEFLTVTTSYIKIFYSYIDSVVYAN